jgi:acetoin utilization deacetylase AcuC-like enzyme
VEHTGAGAGAGTNVNVPLPAGSGRGAYLAAFDRVVEPVVRRFRPELVVVASGFDAGCLDPLGRMMLSAASFAELTRRTRVLADELCGGRLVQSHEGGYSELLAPFCGLRVLEELSGALTGVEDPFVWVDDYAAQELAPHQSAAIDAVCEAHGLTA